LRWTPWASVCCATSMSPREISQILEKMWRNISSLRYSYIREWPPEVAQSAALSQVLFGPIFQAEILIFLWERIPGRR
jgi:hypothetical protein